MGSKSCRTYRKGFTLVEVLMSVMIMSIMAGVMTLSYHAADPTPKREAEKLAAYITRLAQKSDRIKVGFNMKVSGNVLNVSWGENHNEPPFNISDGLTYVFGNCDESNTTLTYNYTKYPMGAKITVSNNENSCQYIKINTATGDLSCYVLVMADDIVTQ